MESDTDLSDKRDTRMASRGAALVPESNESLASRARTDLDAVDELYRRYVHRIYGYCRLRLRDEDAIQDATSAIVVKALEGLRHTQIKRFESWIFTIAHNEVSNRLQRAHPTLDLALASQIPDGSSTTEALVMERMQGDELHDLIRQLAPDQQRVVELRLAELDGREIGRVLGRSRGWVDTTQYRAVRRLRELMGLTPDGKIPS